MGMGGDIGLHPGSVWFVSRNMSMVSAKSCVCRADTSFTLSACKSPSTLPEPSGEAPGSQIANSHLVPHGSPPAAAPAQSAKAM